MKDLPFYEVSHLADNEAKQAHLDTRGEKTPKGDSTPSPWFHFPSGFKSYPRPGKKKIIVWPQVQETVIKPDKTFGAE
ncbi:hypothetical protein CK203_015948 [Vitis vinifera]|uniref:Uncharacterized protein n=1 Tax=Vitis vinifera TaxID=29760 RepID=A0A438JRL7_VITVI|nr:hypothetical protein CK203_015948 [Vitis vinifera]